MKDLRAEKGSTHPPMRVLVVDDSAYSRRTLKKILESHPEIKVVGTAGNGKEALKQVALYRPDLIILDLEMPEMDGFTFLRVLMKKDPLPVIVVSKEDGERGVFKAMDLGAVDFLLKPTKKVSPKLFEIREELLDRVLSLRGIRPRPVETLGVMEEGEVPDKGLHRVEAIAIGASTGGPSAIHWILTQIGYIPSAVLLSQHMPPGFTKAFAERLDRECSMEVKEAEEGEIVRPGRVLIAPGGFHMVFEKKRGKIKVRLIKAKKGDKYVPSIDRMLESAALVWGNKLMGVILTGMGRDGALGARKVKERGGYLVAESRETSLIFSMPEAAISTGLVDEVLPLYAIGERIVKWSRPQRS